MADREYFDRSYPLEGIEILSRAKGGDGRTVEAYAAIFDQPAEIQDKYGHYMETINRAAFNRTLANGAADRVSVLYNHGMTLEGRPDSLAQVPLGRALRVEADGKGLLTVTRYNRSALSEAVLEAIKNDDIRSQSFRGGIYRSDPAKVPTVRAGQPLPNVTRMELGLRDYGPTPIPAYAGAGILAVRSAQEIVSDIAGLEEDERAELIRLLATTRDSDPEPGTATPHRGPGTEDSRTAHSGRSRLLRLKADALFAGVGNGSQAERGHL